MTHAGKLVAGVAVALALAAPVALARPGAETNTTLGITARLASVNATTQAQADEVCFPGAPPSAPGASTARVVRRAGVAETPGFVLKKTGPSNACSGGNILFRGENGIVLTRLGFDLRADSYCQAGAPRFQVKLQGGDGYTSISCAQLEVVATFTDSAGREWRRLRAAEAATGGALNGEELGDVFIAFDETGRAIIDNIAIADATIKQ